MARNYRKNTYHHLYNRGASGRKLFSCDQDYHDFIWRLVKYKEKYSVSILAYCLMPDHYHLFVRQNTDDLLIGKMIGGLMNSYTKSIHSKYGHSRPVFDGTAQSNLIADDTQFLWLVKYITLTPVREKLVSRPEDWGYSSIHEYLGYRKIQLTDIDETMARLKSINGIREFLELDKQTV